LELCREQNLGLIGGSLVDRLGDGAGLVSSCFEHGLQQTLTQLKISVDFDQSVLSHLLVLRNTVFGEVYEGRSRLSKSDDKLIMDSIWLIKNE
jgi:hypothetical protein